MRPSRVTLAICALLGLSLPMAACGAGNAHTATSPPPGVVADCTSALPHRLSIQPSAITLACADNGWGVQNMTWTKWTTSAATGHGMFWDKLCEPSCASGKIGNYPAEVTLSAVKTSSQGPWFSLLTLTWESTRHPPAPDSYLLTPPRN